MISQPSKYNQNNQIACFKWVNFMVYQLHFNKTTIETQNMFMAFGRMNQELFFKSMDSLWRHGCVYKDKSLETGTGIF